MGRDLSTKYNAGASDVNSQLFPFLTSEMKHPQGFGAPILQKMKTEGAQAAAGGAGAAKEAALLHASRTGNSAAVPSVIADATRSAMGAEVSNANHADIANEQLKQQQRQSGAAGLGAMYGQDVSAALGGLGLSNQAIQEWNGANATNKWASVGPNLTQAWLSPMPGGGM
jgi:hypothetical protein